MAKQRERQPVVADESLRMFLVPCSCGVSFAVSEKYDREGTQWHRFLFVQIAGSVMIPRIACSNWATIARDIGAWMVASGLGFSCYTSSRI